jgi:hypothetical protein
VGKHQGACLELRLLRFKNNTINQKKKLILLTAENNKCLSLVVYFVQARVGKS